MDQFDTILLEKLYVVISIILVILFTIYGFWFQFFSFFDQMYDVREMNKILRYRKKAQQRVDRARRRIADDLHDGIGSKAASMALRLELVGSGQELPQEAQEILAELAGDARSIIDDIRDTIWLADSGHDDLASVVVRMEQFAESMIGARGTIQVSIKGASKEVSVEVRRDLYFLFTEAVHNAVRHGQGTRVDVTILATARNVTFRVRDNGIGFDPHQVVAGRGLRTMRQRAATLGGELAWVPRPGGGTEVQFSVALP